MRFVDVISTALTQIRANKLRSFFTLLGIIVSVAFLVAVVAIIQGMNAYVKENVAGAIIGANSFQVRRTPINFGRVDDDEWRRMQRGQGHQARLRRRARALPDADTISIQSGWPRRWPTWCGASVR
ncbi:MAG: ABC transporter permease [Gemmatimonadaceae bacterium]